MMSKWVKPTCADARFTSGCPPHGHSRKKPPESSSPGASWIVGIGYIRQADDAPLNISPRNRVQYVATVRHSRDFVSARKMRADSSRLLQSARRASSIARALRANVRDQLINLRAIHRPPNAQHGRQHHHHIAIGINKSRAATSQCAMHVSTDSSDERMRRASSRGEPAPPVNDLRANGRSRRGAHAGRSRCTAPLMQQTGALSVIVAAPQRIHEPIGERASRRASPSRC